MSKRNKNLPADADAQPKKEPTKFQNQEEHDEQSKQEQNETPRQEEKVRIKQAEDSQTKHEDMIPPEKKKQTEKWDKVERQFPNLKK
jgi:hypothetical protein